MLSPLSSRERDEQGDEIGIKVMAQILFRPHVGKVEPLTCDLGRDLSVSLIRPLSAYSLPGALRPESAVNSPPFRIGLPSSE